MCVCVEMCVLGVVDHKVDTRDCACFWSGIISRAAGCLEHTLSSWEDSGSVRGGQHARSGLLFTAEGGLMSHKGCYGLFELTLLYFRCQMGLDLSQRHLAPAGKFRRPLGKYF